MTKPELQVIKKNCCPVCGSTDIRGYKTTSPIGKNYRVRYFICNNCPPVERPFSFKRVVKKT